MVTAQREKASVTDAMFVLFFWSMMITTAITFVLTIARLVFLTAWMLGDISLIPFIPEFRYLSEFKSAFNWTPFVGFWRFW